MGLVGRREPDLPEAAQEARVDRLALGMLDHRLLQSFTGHLIFPVEMLAQEIAAAEAADLAEPAETMAETQA